MVAHLKYKKIFFQMTYKQDYSEDDVFVSNLSTFIFYKMISENAKLLVVC